ncbi:hypothetical protein D9758_010639 [Tetrapyrgos nigripes]|uniref:Uncharacterized protein n=1 Tax=Tetrapyrgos nigripes TaxID=182062 RepID=A0A8H5GG95_9AGAR|nr:hypothetical protein D9758_010639 [Tetrapyrgos nigripes]
MILSGRPQCPKLRRMPYKDANRLCLKIPDRSGANPTTTVRNTVVQTGTTTGFVTASTTALTVSSDTNAISQTATTANLYTCPAPPNKRGSSLLGDVYPGCPNSLKKVALDIAKTACDCFLGPVQMSNVTSFMTQATTVSVPQTVTLLPSLCYRHCSRRIRDYLHHHRNLRVRHHHDNKHRHDYPDSPYNNEHYRVDSDDGHNCYHSDPTSQNYVPIHQCRYGTRYHDYTLTNDPGPNNDYAGAINTCLSSCYNERSQGCVTSFVFLQSSTLTCYNSVIPINDEGQYLYCDQSTDFSAAFSIVPS